MFNNINYCFSLCLWGFDFILFNWFKNIRKILIGDNYIFNDDGSFVDNELVLIDVHDKFIQGTIDNGFEVYVYDGKNYSSYVFNKYYISPFNSGNISCVIDSGWKK